MENSLEYYIIDTETTGLQAGHHEVVQISMIRCSDRYQLNKYIKAEFPDRASYDAMRVTGKVASDLLKGESKADVINFCDDFINSDGKTVEHRCFVAHNASFDIRFCHKLWEDCDKTFPGSLWMCTKTFSNAYAKKFGIYKPRLHLEGCMNLLKLSPKSGAHDAKIDVQNTYVLWKSLMEKELNYVDFIKRKPHVIE